MDDEPAYWRGQAACRPDQGHDPELWFPERNSRDYLEKAQQAKTICAACPVQTQCHTYAANAGDVTGIWAGRYYPSRAYHYRSPMEGVTRKRYGLQPCGTKAAYQRHQRRGEPVCDACRLAINRINRINRERNARLRAEGHKRRRNR
jgi:hypothetical protein